MKCFALLVALLAMVTPATASSAVESNGPAVVPDEVGYMQFEDVNGDKFAMSWSGVMYRAVPPASLDPKSSSPELPEGGLWRVDGTILIPIRPGEERPSLRTLLVYVEIFPGVPPENVPLAELLDNEKRLRIIAPNGGAYAIDDDGSMHFLGRADLDTSLQGHGFNDAPVLAPSWPRAVDDDQPVPVSSRMPEVSLLEHNRWPGLPSDVVDRQTRFFQDMNGGPPKEPAAPRELGSGPGRDPLVEMWQRVFELDTQALRRAEVLDKPIEDRRRMLEGIRADLALLKEENEKRVGLGEFDPKDRDMPPELKAAAREWLKLMMDNAIAIAAAPSREQPDPLLVDILKEIEWMQDWLSEDGADRDDGAEADPAAENRATAAPDLGRRLINRPGQQVGGLTLSNPGAPERGGEILTNPGSGERGRTVLSNPGHTELPQLRGPGGICELGAAAGSRNASSWCGFAGNARIDASTATLNQGRTRAGTALPGTGQRATLSQILQGSGTATVLQGPASLLAPGLNLSMSGPASSPLGTAISVPDLGGATPAESGSPDNDFPAERSGDDDRTREITDREARQAKERAAEDQARTDQDARDAAARQELIDATMAAHDQAVVEGAAYTEKRDREEAERLAAEAAAAEAERQRQAAEDEERNRPVPPPEPAATEPAPPPYRAPEAEQQEDVEDDDGYVDPPAGSVGPTESGSTGDGSSASDMSNLPDDTWTPSGAPTPPPFELSNPPAEPSPADLV